MQALWFRWFSGLGLFLLLLLAVACSPPTPTQATVDRSRPKLSLTGLYNDISTGELADGVKFYQPQYPLWSDGTTKKRWILLPDDEKIDTSKMDNWQFPVGTKIWKEFSKDGKKLETRLMERVGGGPWDWVMVSYIWDASGKDAQRALIGQSDVHSTSYDVPHAGYCTSCHGGRSSRVLGFSALQLSHDKKGITLKSLIADKLLTDPPKGNFTLPGNDTQKAALGYLHSNCGSCHNPDNKTQAARLNPTENYPFSFLLTTTMTSIEQTDTYKTVLSGKGIHGGALITKGAPDKSRVYKTMNRTGSGRMPSVGSEDIDKDGVALIKKWIESLK